MNITLKGKTFWVDSIEMHEYGIGIWSKGSAYPMSVSPVGEVRRRHKFAVTCPIWIGRNISVEFQDDDPATL